MIKQKIDFTPSLDSDQPWHSSGSSLFAKVPVYIHKEYSKCSKILNTNCLPKRHGEKAQTKIRLLLEKQSDQDLSCLLL